MQQFILQRAVDLLDIFYNSEKKF